MRWEGIEKRQFRKRRVLWLRDEKEAIAWLRERHSRGDYRVAVRLSSTSAQIDHLRREIYNKKLTAEVYGDADRTE